MDKIFDINRFGNLFEYECRNYLPRITNALITYVCIIFSLWVTVVAAQTTLDSWARVSFISSIMNIACAIGPFLVYYNANNRKKGYVYALLPASALEKFISMLIICLIVVPLLSYATLTFTDYLLYLLSPQDIFGFNGFDFYNPFFMGLRINGSVSIGAAGSTTLSFLFSISVSMMYNMVLRNAKIIKAILISIAVIFTFVIAFIVCIVNDVEFFFEAQVLSPSRILTIVNVMQASLTVLFLWITYRRIKKVNY